MSLPQGLRRVTPRHPCPICGHSSWCTFEGTATTPLVVYCPRVESRRRAGGLGFVHELDPSARRRKARQPASVRVERRPDFGDLHASFVAALPPDRRARLAKHLGVSESALARLEVGWSGSAWSFPMRDESDRVVGIRLRRHDGSKFAIKGSASALFVPRDLDFSGPLFVAEGPTDSAALLDLGVEAIGRPDCNGGVRPVGLIVRRRQPKRIVVVADRDEVGALGAQNLADRLRVWARDVRVVAPPRPHKDAREWLKAGATREALTALVDGAQPIALTVRVSAGGAR